MQTTLTIIGIALIVMAVFLVISVLMQSSKNHRVSGTIAGGAETFFGKSKGKTMDAIFNKLTTIVTIIFVILVVVLYVIQPETTTPEIVIPEDEISDTVVDDVDGATTDDPAQTETTETQTTTDDTTEQPEQTPDVATDNTVTE